MAQRITSTVPGQGSHEVTPHDTNNLSPLARELFIEVGGDIVIVGVDGTEDTWTVPNNFYLRVACKKVKATGTTATGIHAIH